MSSCSTAASAHRGHERRRRRPSCDAAHLETRMRVLTTRSSAPRHRRRTRSATGAPSSAVTAAAPGDLYGLLRCSPKRLVSSLQHAGSTTDSDGAGTVERGKTPTGPHDEDDAFSACSAVEGQAGYSSMTAVHVPAAASSSCSCHCRCAVLCCGYSSSSTAAASSPFPAAGGAAGEHARTKEEGKWVTGRIGWLAAIALLAVGIIVAMAVCLELGEGSAEFLVPT